MKKYDSNLYFILYLRTRAIVITSTVLSLLCLVGAVTSKSEAHKRLFYGSTVITSINGLMSTRSQESLAKAQEDVSDVSDQVRTNELYSNVITNQPRDYTPQLYNYIVMLLGQGRSVDEVLDTLSKNRAEAMAILNELEMTHGKLPTGY